jgi:hypothetical protein
MNFEYRIFFVHNGDERTFSHFSGERLSDGAVIRVNKPGTDLHGQSITMYRVVSHPSEDGPGIAYARGAEPWGKTASSPPVAT